MVTSMENFGFTEDADNGIVLGVNPFVDKPLIDSSNENVMVIGPCRSGKGVNTCVPTALTWKGSMFCYDPKAELYGLTFGYRKNVLGQTVLMFHPYAKDGSSVKWNPFDEIRYGTVNEYKDIVYIASSILGIDTERISEYVGFLSDSVKKESACLAVMLTGLMMYTIKTKDNPTINDVLSYVNDNTLDSLLQLMNDTPDVFKGLGEIYMDAFPIISNEVNELKLLVYDKLKERLLPFSNELCGDNLSSSDFSLSDFLNKKKFISFYFAPTLKNVKGEMAIGQVLLQMLSERVHEFQVCNSMHLPKKSHLLFLLDEFNEIQPIHKFVKYLSSSHVFGYARYALICRDLAGLRQFYEDKVDDILAKVNHRVYFTPNTDAENYTLDTIMKELASDLPADRFSALELIHLPTDKVIIHLKGNAPILANKLRYYENKVYVDYTNIPLE